jgi:hypothetical protein
MTPRRWFEKVERTAHQNPDAYDRLKRQISEETEAASPRAAPVLRDEGHLALAVVPGGPWEPETARRSSNEA